MAGTVGRDRIKVIAFSPNYSTRYLVEVALDPQVYALDMAPDEPCFLSAVRDNTHSVYVIDAARAASAAPGNLFKDMSGLVLKHMLRVVAIADKAPAENALKMTDFGPLAIIGFDFSRSAMVRAVQGVLHMSAEWQPKRDTGSRVKADPKFYKEIRFSE